MNCRKITSTLSFQTSAWQHEPIASETKWHGEVIIRPTNLSPSAFGDRKDATPDSNHEIVVDLLGGDLEQRRPSHFVSLLHPVLQRALSKIAMFEEIRSEVPVSAPSCWVFKKTIVVDEDTNMQIVLGLDRFWSKYQERRFDGVVDELLIEIVADHASADCLHGVERNDD